MLEDDFLDGAVAHLLWAFAGDEKVIVATSIGFGELTTDKEHAREKGKGYEGDVGFRREEPETHASAESETNTDGQKEEAEFLGLFDCCPETDNGEGTY